MPLATTYCIMLLTSRLFKKNIRQFWLSEKLGFDVSVTTIAAACLVMADAEMQKRKPRREKFCFGNKHRDTVFTELVFNDSSLLISFISMSDCDFNYLLQPTVPIISKQDPNFSDNISVSTRLAITLLFLLLDTHVGH
jgi:hypothetical protein